MEKRRVLTYEFSNSSWRNGKLLPHYRKPSDLLAVTIGEHQKKMATSRLKSSHFENWLPGRDSLRLRSGLTHPRFEDALAIKLSFFSRRQPFTFLSRAAAPVLDIGPSV